VIAAPGQAREKSAGGLNSILRISSETNHGVLNVFRTQIGAVRCRRAVRSIGRWQYWS